ncbi:TerB N-terminal domain-containing protein [Roseovarius sp. MS2]|uniref:TerB N-terminal domain-containing protein n=1 Tax=Roseovarius sp. MS2 TaxID=3390728 RepID=UPI003EDCA0D2
MKFIRIVFSHTLFFVLVLIISAFFIDHISDGSLVLIMFVAPAVLVWLYEKRRTRRLAAAQPLISAVDVAKVTPAAINDTSAVTRASAAAEWPKISAPPLPPVNNAPPPPVAPVRAVPPPTVKSSRIQGWVAKGQTVSVRGREIGGMVYVGTAPSIDRYGYGEKCRAYIDPGLTVAREGNDIEGAGMPYWPGYSTIPPQCRATYLDWLEGGASDGSYNPGYMFLYFYGLERRFFVDNPSVEEKRDLLAEVRRLSQVFEGNRSAQRYLGEFIQLAVVSTTEIGDIAPVFDNHGWDVPFSVKLAIGTQLLRGEALNADWVLSWFLCHPEKSLRTSAKRCAEEFRLLFKLRFGERFPEGLKVTKPRKMLETRYQAASREFEWLGKLLVDDKPIPDISGLRKPIEIAQEIADEVMEDLEKFSRYLGRTPEGRGSVEAHALLPAELREMFPSEELEKIKTWAGAILGAGGLVPVGDVLEQLEGTRPEKPSKRQLTGVADALARLGFGLAPDPRFALRSPKVDEPVVIFELGGPVEQLEDVSNAYKAALMELALGSFVAHADGTISESERAALQGQAENVEGLSDHEQRRLHANLKWFLAVPPDITLLRRKLKDCGADQQSAIRAALVGAALADGIVQPEEVAEIEKVYRALGLDPNLVYSDLHAGEVPDSPVRVRVAQPGATGEAIPPEPAPQAQKLDTARIASIRQDTDRVSAVLANIFTGEEEAEPETEAPSPLAGLDEKHTALIRDVVTRPHWSEEEFAELASRHGLMVAGALETLNEWSFGVYDEALLDEYEGYDLSPDVADAVANALGQEN